MTASTFRLRFFAGSIAATPAALEALVEHVGGVNVPATIAQLLRRHVTGDWGDLDEHDRQANERALVSGARLLSAYQLGDTRVWIITEAAEDEDEPCIRSRTTVLLPEEY